MLLTKKETNEKNSIEKVGYTKIQKDTNEKSKYWNIVKGVGILSIVIGHASCPIMLRKFVYIFHLVIFYFVAAYFYKEDKYGDKPFEYFAIRFKKMWVKYFFYSSALVLLHNLFLKFNLYENINYYTFSDYLVKISNNLIFASSESFAAALWFVPTLIAANGLFAIIIYISRKFSLITDKKEDRKYFKYIFIIIMSALIGGIGVFLNENKLEILYQIHTVFLVMPIYAFAYFFKIITIKYSENIKKVKWYIYLILAILFASFISLIISNGMEIELLQEQIINGYMFYIVSVVGICFCLSISKIIEKLPLISNMFSIMGKHSFTIMALHFIFINFVNIIYNYIVNETNLQMIRRCIILHPEIRWILCVILGTTIPVLISLILDFIKKNIKRLVDEKA